MLSTPIGLAVAMPGTTGVQLVSDIGMGAGYDSNDAVNPTASLTITFKRDGTWAITVGGADVLSGVPTTGDWAVNKHAAIGDDATVIFATANAVNSPSITNNAATDTPITGDISIVISRGAGVAASCDVTCTVKSGGNQVAETTAVGVDGT